MPEVRALTLWQPMAWAISDFTKRIENRPWKPWAGVTHIAIHAGAKYHRAHAEQIHEAFGVEVPRELPHGALVAVARLVGYIHVDDGPMLTQLAGLETDPWFSGPYGWVLADVTKLPEPIACKGALGLWKLPPKILTAVEQHIG